MEFHGTSLLASYIVAIASCHAHSTVIQSSPVSKSRRGFKICGTHHILSHPCQFSRSASGISACRYCLKHTAHPLMLSVRVTPSREALNVTTFILSESIPRSCSTDWATVCSSPGAARSTLPRYTRLHAV